MAETEADKAAAKEAEKAAKAAAKEAAGGKRAEPPKDAVVRTPPVPLSEDRYGLKEHRDPGHWICVKVGTTIEDLLEPAFYANIARHWRPSNTVTVTWDDQSQFAELYVMSCGRNWASVDVLRHKHLKAASPKHLTEQYEVAFNGPVDLFRILRLSDRAVIKAGFATEAAALQFLAEYKRKLAA